MHCNYNLFYVCCLLVTMHKIVTVCNKNKSSVCACRKTGHYDKVFDKQTKFNLCCNIGVDICRYFCNHIF